MLSISTDHSKQGVLLSLKKKEFEFGVSPEPLVPQSRDGLWSLHNQDTVGRQGRIRLANQKEPEPENALHRLVGNIPEPIKRQDFLVLVPSGSQIEHGQKGTTFYFALWFEFTSFAVVCHTWVDVV